MKILFGLFGKGGFGREVMPLSVTQIKNDFRDCSYEIVFVDQAISKIEEINGYKCVPEETFFLMKEDADQSYFNAAIGNSAARENIYNKCCSLNIKPLSITSQTTSVLDSNKIERGAIFCGYTTVTSNAIIGKMFQCNIYSYVAHDCIIGNYVTFAPGVKCNGGVVVKDHAYIGTGAIIKQSTPDKKIVIGEGAVVGMGAVVTKSVAPGDVVIGNPARPR